MAELEDKPELNEEDLEDGEIDDSDEEANAEKQSADKKDDVIIVDKNSEMPKPKHNPFAQKLPLKSTNKLPESMVTIDLSNDTANTRPVHNPMPMPLKSKAAPVVDDFAGNIENALAQILKKKGIEPALPKMLENKLQKNKDEESASGAGHGQSKSSRRRKRKKQKEDKKREEEEKDRSEKVNIIFLLNIVKVRHSI